MRLGRFLRILARERRSTPPPDRVFEQAGWWRPGEAGVILIGGFGGFGGFGGHG
jgi:hypothetical protein